MFELQENHCEEVKKIFFIPQERKDTFRQVSGAHSIVGTASQIKATSIHNSLIEQGLCCYSIHGLPEFNFYDNLDMRDYRKWISSPVTQMEQIRSSLRYFCDKCNCLFNSKHKMGFLSEKQAKEFYTINCSSS